ncbi:uncharacterized protein [Ptychodera flava]|uniref:uncharacterized protein n=1 Tax=Ptychodera flava TaxID=63121 RepID=UPI00396A956F
MIKDEKIRSLENNIAQLKAKAHVQVLSRDKDTFVCRSPESDKRGTAYHKLAKPAIASSIASQKSLEQRANALKSFLDSLSAKGEATTDDIVSTLAKFATIYKDVYTQAGIKAGILASQVLSPTETLDLKLLLRLPMKRLRELRTFLQCRYRHISK